MSFKSGLSISDSINYDLIIIGAGAAGLSLLIALDKADYEGSILIIEANDSLKDDRIWSFWKSEPLLDSIEQAVQWRWNNWSLEADNDLISLSDNNIPYCSIPAGQLHKAAYQILARRHNVTLVFGCRVDNHCTSNYQNFIQCSDKTFSSNYVVDTRPPKLNRPKYGLLQCFV